jgi:hypothetical protein
MAGRNPRDAVANKPNASGGAQLSNIDERLRALGLALPAPLELPPGAVLPFPWVRVVGERAAI